MNNNFGGIDLNQRRENHSDNKGLDVPDLDGYLNDIEARKEVQRRADEMARNINKDDTDHKQEIARMQNELKRNMLKRKKVVRRRKTIIAVAIIATAIAAGIISVKVVPKLIDNLPSASQETTQHEVTLDELKADLEAGYSEVQINGHWYGTKDAIESMEQGVSLDASKSIDQMAQDNIDENNKTR